MRILKFVGVAAVVAFAACSKSIYGGGGGGAPCDGQGADVVVNANASLRFSPESILITTGKKVCWQNTASFPHTVTSDTGTVLSSGNVAGGGFYVHTFASTGTVAYHCTMNREKNRKLPIQPKTFQTLHSIPSNLSWCQSSSLSQSMIEAH